MVLVYTIVLGNATICCMNDLTLGVLVHRIEEEHAMADRLSRQERSALMGRIRGKNTKPEILVRKALHKAGFRFRIHDRRLPGSPDIVLPKYRTVVFVHGCFWHGHDECKCFCVPKTNGEFWKKKIDGNRERDEKNRVLLERKGWRIIVVWECELQKRAVREATLAGLVNEIWALQ